MGRHFWNAEAETCITLPKKTYPSMVGSMGWQGMGRQAPRRRVSNPFEPLNNQQSPTSPDGQHSELATNGHFNGFGGGGGSKKVLTVQELNAKREAIFQKELERAQNESKVMSDRYMAEAQKRENLLHNEQESRLREEQKKQELMQQRLAEYEKIGKARKAELQRQDDLLTQKHLRAEEDAKRAIDEERLQEERKIALERAKEEQENRAEVMRKRDEARKVKETQMEKQREAKERLRQKEMERLQSVIQKEQEAMSRQQMIQASLKAEAASKSVSSGGGPVIVSPHQAGARPRDVNAFGFGNVRTGQVTSKKLAFLTRASSVGAEKRERLGSTSSGRPTIGSSPSMPPSPAPKQKHWPLPPGGVGKGDFANSTKALGTGLTRRDPNTQPNLANRYHT